MGLNLYRRNSPISLPPDANHCLNHLPIFFQNLQDAFRARRAISPGHTGDFQTCPYGMKERNESLLSPGE